MKLLQSFFLFGICFINIINAYIGIKCLFLGIYYYLITFICLFILERLLSYSLLNAKGRNRVFLIMELMQLGWIVVFFEDKPYHIQNEIDLKSTLLYPLLLIQQIILFGTNFIGTEVLQDSQIPLLAFFSYIISICMLFLKLKYFLPMFIVIPKELALPLFSSAFTQSSLFTLGGPFGIKLGFYTIVLNIISGIVYLKVIPRYTIDLVAKIAFLLNRIIRVSYSDHLPQSNEAVTQFFTIEEYFIEYTKYILLVIYGLCYLTTINFSSTAGEKIYAFNIILGLIIGMIYAIHNIQNFYYQFCCLKIITYTESKIDMELIAKIPLKKRRMKKLILLALKDFDKIHRFHCGQNDIEGLFDNQYYDCGKCAQTKQLLQKLSFLSLQGVQINYDTSPSACEEHSLQMMGNLFFYPLNNFSLFRLRKQEVMKVMLQRFSNGFFCGAFSLFNTALKNNLPKEQLNEFQRLISTTFSVYLFYFKIQQYMKVSYSQVLYDLHEE